MKHNLRFVLFFVLCFLFCVCLFPHQVRGSSFPPTILFGQSSPFSGVIAGVGQRLRAGILAAFKEVNDKGGVKGTSTLQLVSEDDKYNFTWINVTVQKLLSENPTLFAFIGFYGSPTTQETLYWVKKFNIPDIGPLTGSAVFRKTFCKHIINIRAGYDDESFAMLNILLNVKKVKRIALFFQDDAFGEPSKNNIVNALTAIGMKLSAIEPYDVVKQTVATHNFTATAERLLASKPQGLILFSVGEWTTELILAAKTMATWEMAFVTGSWMGSAVASTLQERGTDPSNVFVTQTFPHPETAASACAVCEAYRTAIRAYEGASAEIDYLSLEGYIEGRFAVEVLERAVDFSREAFFDVVYKTKMFQIDDLLAGPYTSDCSAHVGAASEGGRSSLCNCNQGFRFVTITSLTSSYKYQPVEAFKLKYPISECYATLQTVFQFQITFARVFNSSYSAAYEFTKGFTASEQSGRYSVLKTDYAPQTKNVTRILDNVVDTTSAVGIIGQVGISTFQPGIPLIGLFDVPEKVQELNTPFTRENIGVSATLRHQIMTNANMLRSMSEAATLQAFDSFFEVTPGQKNMIGLCRPESVKLVAEALSLTANHFNLPSPSVHSYSTIASALSPFKNAEASIFVFDIASITEFEYLLTFSSTERKLRFFLPFLDAAAFWNGSKLCQTLQCSRVHVATNIPLWFETISSTATEKQLILEVNATNPMAMFGFFVGRSISFVLDNMGKMVASNEFINTWYRTSVITVGDVKLGPYIDRQCLTVDCLCNQGATVVKTYNLGDLASHSIKTAGVSYQFLNCKIEYKPRVESSSEATLVVFIVCAVVLIVAAAGAGFAGHKVYLYRQTAAAPKNTKLPVYILFIALKDETMLREQFPNEIGEALGCLQKLIRKAIKKSKCYEVKQVGTAHMVATDSAQAALHCAGQVQILVRRFNWDQVLPPQEIAMSATGSRTHRTGTESFSNFSGTTGKESCMHTTLSVGVGIHCGMVSITPDEAANRYDYTGPVVSVSAEISDIAQGGQILCSDTVFDKELSARFTGFTRRMINSTDVGLLQFNPPGQPILAFDVPAEEACVDSVAAALDQTNNGVTSKKVTILVVYLHEMAHEVAHHAVKGDKFSKEYSEMLQAVHTILVRQRGKLERFAGGKLVISFNAALPTPKQSLRAYYAAEEILAVVDSPASCAFYTGTALVGPFIIPDLKQSHFAMLGNASEVAGSLECRYRNMHTELNIVTLDNALEEVNSSSVIQIVDIIQPPFAKSPQMVIGLMALKTFANDTWLADGSEAEVDQYASTNRAFVKLMEGTGQGFAEAQSIVQSLNPEMEELPGVAKLKEIISTGSLAKYLEANKQAMRLLRF